MKTLTRTSKAMMFVLVAMLLCVATVFAACNPAGSNDDGTVGNAITQYDADLDASITMGLWARSTSAAVLWKRAM